MDPALVQEAIDRLDAANPIKQEEIDNWITEVIAESRGTVLQAARDLD